MGRERGCVVELPPFLRAILQGISTNNTEQFDDEKNKRRYDLEQKQRAAERNLRELRRRMNA